jgi:RNA polymerase sigma-70 factor, ECF subfamily
MAIASLNQPLILASRKGPQELAACKSMDCRTVTPVEQSDRDLMIRIRGDDQEALQVLMNRYWKKLWAYSSEIVSDSDEAEDVVLETFVKIWYRRIHWAPSGPVAAYLYRITRNVALNTLRSRKARVRLCRKASEAVLDTSGSAGVDALFDEEAMRVRVKAAIELLPMRRREVFILSRFHELTHREIGEALGISLQTVANQMSRALSDLREALRDVAEESSREE